MRPYWQSSDGRLVIYHDRAEYALPKLATSSLDLVVTSPPYNLSDRGFFAAARDYQIDPKKSKWTGAGLVGGYDEHDDAMPWGEYRDWQRGILTECWRLLRRGGAIFYNHKPRQLNGHAILPLEYNPSLPLRQVIIWDRVEPGLNVNTGYFTPRCEWLLLLAGPTFRLIDKSAAAVGDVWAIQRDRGLEHPAPFPLALPLRAISSTAAEIVLDPFMGSGTTLVAAQALGRRGIGIERSERWCEYAARRLEDPPLLAAVKAEQGDLFSGAVS